MVKEMKYSTVLVEGVQLDKICLYCEMITAINLANIHHHT